MTNNARKAIAETILSQLGGRRFIAFTGAKEFVAIESGLMFDYRRVLQKMGSIRLDHFTLLTWRDKGICFYPF